MKSKSDYLFSQANIFPVLKSQENKRSSQMQDDTDLLWNTQTYQIVYQLLNHNPYNFLNVISTSTALDFTNHCVPL